MQPIVVRMKSRTLNTDNRKKEKPQIDDLIFHLKKLEKGSSLLVQWLGIGTFTAPAWVHFLVVELRSCKSCGLV